MRLWKDVRAQTVKRRQRLFDAVCTACFIGASAACAMTIVEYYRAPHGRCSTNSERVFGISTAGEDALVEPNVWIMSQTTYASFFALVLVCVFSVCGCMTLLLQAVTRRRNRVVEVAIAPPHKDV